MAGCIEASKELVASAQEVLERTQITIVGMGGLGTNTAEILVRMGARNLHIIDDDIVEESNLNRQTLYTLDDIGKAKVDVAKEKLTLMARDVKVHTSKTRMDESTIAELLGSSQLILDCLDNNEGRADINSYCKENNKHWIHAAVIGFRGQVLVVSPDKNCSHLFNKERQECSEMGVLTTAVVMTSTIQAQYTIQHLLGKTPQELARINAKEPKIDYFSI